MKFSRFQAFFGILSVITIISLFCITYFYYDGFSRSLSFDGGVRISLRLPPAMGKEDLQKAASNAGFQDAIIRLTNPRTNQWDIELGPQVRDAINVKVKVKEIERQKKIKKFKDRGDAIPTELRSSLNVSDEIVNKILPQLKLSDKNVVSSEAIAASYGANLSSIALRILIYTIVAIGLYLTFRFNFVFAIAASTALVHDFLFTLAFIGITRIEPSIPVLAAALTVLGYSINDTIVIFDRIRDNTKNTAKNTNNAIIDLSLTQTLSRTTVTSILTIVAVGALLIGGERSLRDFAIVVLFGVLIGTYSSVFIAAPSIQYYQHLRNWLRR